MGVVLSESFDTWVGFDTVVAHDSDWATCAGYETLYAADGDVFVEVEGGDWSRNYLPTIGQIANARIEADIEPGNADDWEIALGLRVQPNGDGYYCRWANDGGSGNFYLEKVVGGVVTTLAGPDSWGTAEAFRNPMFYVDGNLLWLTVDDQIALSATDPGSSFSTGYVGMAGWTDVDVTSARIVGIEVIELNMPYPRGGLESGRGGNGTGTVNLSSVPDLAQDGDYLILAIESLGSGTGYPDPPSTGGWSLIGTQASATDGAADRTRITVYGTFYDAGSPPGLVVPDGGDHINVWMSAWARVDTGDPYDGPVADFSATNATSFDADGITTLVDNCSVVLCVAFGDDGVGASDKTASGVGTLLHSWGWESSSGTDGTVEVEAWSKETAGATGNFTWTSSASEEFASLVFALRPVPSSSGDSAGSAAPTDSRDSATASGSATAPASSGSVSASDSRDSVTAAGSCTPPQASASVNANDSRDAVAGSASVSSPTATGSTGVSDVRDTSAGSGISTKPTSSASAAPTDSRDTASASGSASEPVVSGALAVADSRDTGVGGGTATQPVATGSSSPIDAADTVSGAGASVAPHASGSSSASDSEDYVSATGTSSPPTHSGSASISDVRDSAVGSASAAVPVSAASGSPSDTRDNASGMGVSEYNAVVGTSNASDVRDFATGSGSSTVPTIQGSVSASDIRDSVSAVVGATTPVASGSLSTLDVRDSLTGTGHSTPPVSTAEADLGDSRDSVSASGQASVPVISGTLLVVDSPDGATGFATVQWTSPPRADIGNAVVVRRGGDVDVIDRDLYIGGQGPRESVPVENRSINRPPAHTSKRAW